MFSLPISPFYQLVDTSTIVFLIALDVIGIWAVGILAVWVVRSRWPRLVRLAIFATILSPLIVVPAYDLLLCYSIEALLIVAILVPIRRRQPHQGGWRSMLQFSVGDLLLLMVAIAVLVTIAMRIPEKSVELGVRIAVVASLGAVITLVAVWLTYGRARRWVWLTVAVVCFPALPVVAWLLAWDLSWANRRRVPQLAAVWAARLGLAVLSLAIFLPLPVVFWPTIFKPPIPSVTLPNPNGYVEVAQIGKRLQQTTVPDVSNATPQALAAFLTQYGDDLDAVRESLKLESCVPVDYRDPLSIANINTLQDIRQIARALYAAGQLATLEDKQAEAVDCYLDVVRLGETTSRGGLIVDLLVGIAFEEMGVNCLDRLQTLPTEQRRRVIDTLLEYDGNREPFDVIVARDRIYEAHAYSWGNQLAFSDDSNRSYRTLFERPQAILRLLVTDLAIEQYFEDHGHVPDALDDLVPDYLPAVLDDPFTGRPLVYRRENFGYRLYSVGLDEIDDGGFPSIWLYDSSGDFTSDNPFRLNVVD